MGSPKVVAAAYAAASWARARRATWAEPGAPLPQVTVPPAAPPPAIHTPPPDVVASIAEAGSPLESPPPVADATPSSPSKSADWMRPALGTLGWLLPRAAAAALVLAGAVVGGRYVMNKLAESRSRAETPGPSAAAPKPAPTATGGLRITSTPPGAQVLLDGEARGVTPLALTDLTAGAHALELKSPDGTVRRSVTVVADREVEVAESIFSGWVAVRAPFDVTVNEGGRALRIDDRGQIMLPPGPHELRLVNRRLAYDQVHRVEVKPGEIAALTIAPPRSTVTITASEPSEVWIDGVRAGDTPLTDAAVDVGTREIVVRRASGGAERKVTATVTTKPYSVNIDFRERQP